jgi:hypothetical protein
MSADDSAEQAEAGVTGLDWTRAEVEIVVGDYFEMLIKELAGVS